MDRGERSTPHGGGRFFVDRRRREVPVHVAEVAQPELFQGIDECSVLLHTGPQLLEWRYCANHPNTVSCHNMLLAGFITQCVSSGKYKNCDGTPCRCSAVNSCMASVKGIRKSPAP